ncbi:hypothetical protein [Bradyrhizobium sp. DASA03120]|uniref:hypothetical protein n=1 Tax=Bradyrhizobium sp. SMVTL-02 TaxID=3395917 RepID=UPI003F6F89DB
MMRLRVFRAMLLPLLAWAAMLPARAQQVPLQDKPFAQHEIVLQLSDVGEYWIARSSRAMTVVGALPHAQ